MIVAANPYESSFGLEILKWATPVLLFFLAYFINNLISRCKRKKEKRLIKEYIITQIKSLIKKIESQIKENRICLEKVKSWDEKDQTLTRVTGEYISKIKSVSFRDQFEILVTNPIGKDKDQKDQIIERYNKLQSCIDYFEDGLKTLFVNNDKFNTNLDLFINNWNQSHANIIRLGNHLISSLIRSGKEPQKDPFVNKFVDIQNKFKEKHGARSENIKLAYDEIITPQLNHCKEFSNDKRAPYLMSLLLEAKYAYIQIKTQKDYQMENLIGYNSTFEEQLSLLKKALQSIENEA